MTFPIGGSTASIELADIPSFADRVPVIDASEYQQRMEKLRELMAQSGVDAVYLDATTSLRYFTGMKCYPSERLHGAIISNEGELIYLCPQFEEEKTRASMVMEGDFACWEEHENPTELVIQQVLQCCAPKPKLAIDPNTPFFTANRLQANQSDVTIENAEAMINACRQIKSPKEIDLLSTAKAATLRVHQAVARILHEGIDTREVQSFLDDAHRACALDGASTFKIVLFGEPTAYPHGVPYPQKLKENDMVLIDTGATLDGYHSDITRSYVFGEPNERQRMIWDLEKAAQGAAFEAAQIGAPCSAPDAAARQVIAAAGFGPDYQTPGLPHRTGHGVGLDVHEHPYIVRGNETPLTAGMCFSIEPMICSYGEFGVRLEDHAYMTADGPHWFTTPAASIDDPI